MLFFIFLQVRENNASCELKKPYFIAQKTLLGIESKTNETLTSKVMVQIKLCVPTEEPSLLLCVVPTTPHRHSLK